MERRHGDDELRTVVPSSSEIATEARDNAAWAAAIDGLFVDTWTQHLREICLQAMRDDTDEAGLQEACRRAFREGYWAGREQRGAQAAPPAAPPAPGRTV